MNVIKRYVVFYGDEYYPLGGMLDLLCYADFVSEALAKVKEHILKNYDSDCKYNPVSVNEYISSEVKCQWFHIYDLHDSKMVYCSDTHDRGFSI